MTALARGYEMATETPILPASFPLGRAWFVAMVEPRREQFASREIERLGFGVFCPTESRQRVIRGRKLWITDPLFRGYLFVHFDRERDEWGLISAARGVIDILRNGLFPLQVPDREMKKLQDAVATGVFDIANTPQPGEEVEITDGPFAGLIAKVKSAEPKKRAKILLAALGSIEIDLCFLRRA